MPRGSLDEAPILIGEGRSPELRLFFFWAVPFLVFSGISGLAWALKQSGPDNLLFACSALCILLGALGAGQIALRMARPNYLRIEKDGLVCRLDLRTRRFAWRDFSSFKIDPGDEYQRIFAIYSDINRIGRLGGESEYFGGAFIHVWEIVPDELLKLLSAAHTRWGH